MRNVIYSGILVSLIFSSFELDVNDHTNGRGGRLGVRDVVSKNYQEIENKFTSLIDA